MAYTAWSVLAGEQPTAAKWNLLGTNDASFNDGTGIGTSAITPEKLFAGNGTSWTSQSWTPTWGNLSVGNGTVTAKYTLIGKVCIATLNITFGSTTSVSGFINFTLPVNFSSDYTAANTPFMGILSLNAGGAGYFGTARAQAATSNKVEIVVNNSATPAQQAATSATVPGTWNSTSNISGTITYATT